MTHSAHRYGTREELQNDYVLFIRPCKQFDDLDTNSREETLSKTKTLAEVFYKHNPVNLGRTNPGSISQGLSFSEVMAVPAMNGFMSVFVSKTQVEKVLEEIKNLDLGLSVVSSGSIEDIFDISKTIGLQPHTVLCSLGIWGKKERLPSENHLKIMTLCGHSMVPASLIDYCLEEIRKGNLSLEQAAKKLAKPCPCGIFNIPKTIEILKKMLKDLPESNPVTKGEK